MARPQFTSEVVKPLLHLLDNPETMNALAEVLSAECRYEKETASREALSKNPSLAEIVQHEAKAAAWADFEDVIRRACGLP